MAFSQYLCQSKVELLRIPGEKIKDSACCWLKNYALSLTKFVFKVQIFREAQKKLQSNVKKWEDGFKFYDLLIKVAIRYLRTKSESGNRKLKDPKFWVLMASKVILRYD
jgi:hypothetical protein